jgi:hypothetical protein
VGVALLFCGRIVEPGDRGGAGCGRGRASNLEGLELPGQVDRSPGVQAAELPTGNEGVPGGLAYGDFLVQRTGEILHRVRAST